MRFLLLPLIILGMGTGTNSANAQVKPVVTAADPSAMELKARKIYERLTGTKLPADSPVVAQMVTFLNKGDVEGAAKIATADDNFLNITVKLMALKLSTRDETIKTDLNDMVAAFIGVTRDQRDARELLNGNFYYRGADNLTGVRSNLVADILLTNNHYIDLEDKRVNLAKNLVRVNGQVIAVGDAATVANPDPAGVLTSRAFQSAHTVMGTNRRLVEYTFREFMCVPLSEWADTGASDLRIGRDIDRFPGGDHNKFLTSCKGCHTVMDGFRGAFAKWEVNNNPAGIKHVDANPHSNTSDAYTIIVDNSTGVIQKYNKNANVFPAGYVTRDDSWVNNAIREKNANFFEWRGNALSGNGAKSFGTTVANSRRFSQCMAKRAYETVCRKTFDEAKDLDKLKTWGVEFENSGYKLKSLFEKVAAKPGCLE
ncbi:hypothetical protein DOM22_08155 [Bdellovibrio sp. ZAP7]|uniref:hypothetical protein n=1 Tax=Bdellovibrio sp. ZAP7 TaxID=2231053 RepID=UPI00115ACAD8|nr:hypothetical protein [Bdellovibrio sp. ZAP7]QDK45130.1 hypothetical protein DOM22_08155 [Bdellovibrio sp. ZAP7]